MAINAVKIAISLPKEDFRLLEAMSKKLGITRSALIDKAIHYWLSRRRQEEMIKRYEEGYRRNPESIAHIAALEKTGSEAMHPGEDWS
ncbi:ribbon-helix-helix domain-containing protein [Candidatus Omnitrophota bacterium]